MRLHTEQILSCLCNEIWVELRCRCGRGGGQTHSRHVICSPSLRLTFQEIAFQWRREQRSQWQCHTHTHTTFLSLSLSLSPLTGFLIYDSNSLVQMQPALITVYMYFILLPSPCLSFCAFTFPCTAWLIIPSTLSTVFLIFQKYNLSQQHERKRERLWGPNVKHPY